MSKSDPEGLSPHDREELSERDARALTEYMTVLPEGGDVFSVTTESGAEYGVDARQGRCTCPDHQYREVRCKHLRRVVFARGERPIPSWVDPDAVDPDLGAHVDGTPRVETVRPAVVRADGGVVSDDSPEAPDTAEATRPDDCDCSPRVELPCWPCYREGHETPNPAAGE